MNMNDGGPVFPQPQGWPQLPEGFKLVNALNPITGDNYAMGLWSRRNWEAAMEDQGYILAAAPEVPR